MTTKDGEQIARLSSGSGPFVAARVIAMALLICCICSSRVVAAPAGYSLFYVPADETNMATVFTESTAAAVNNDSGITKPMRSIIGITSWTDGTKIYIDHWEDGYEMDLDNPDATADEILPLMNSGDQRTLLSTFVPSLLSERSDPSDATPTDCKCTTCTPGVTPQTGVPAGFATNCFYDGKDLIYAVGGTVTVTRAMLPENVAGVRPAYVEAVSWEVYPVRPQLTRYILPFGENLGLGFEIVHALVQATENNTIVQTDFNSDGVFDAIDYDRNGSCNDAVDANAGNGFKLTLTRGQAMLFNRNSDGNGGAGCTAPNSGLNTGTLIEGSSTLQVQYTVGDPAASCEIRNYSAFPRGLWDDEYYASVPGMTNGGGTDIFLHNAYNTPLTVNYEHRFGSGTLTIPANGTISYFTETGGQVPLKSAMHFKSADGRVFWGVSAIDRAGSAYDWSYSLVPAYLLTSQYFIGWAPSNSSIPPTSGEVTANGIFLTPAQDNTTVFVDYDRNGTVDSTYTLNRLETIFLCDVNNNAACNTAGNNNTQNDASMSGASIWATGPFIAAYGQNTDNATTGSGLDLGYTTLPDADWIDYVIRVSKSTNPAVHGTGINQIATYTAVVTSTAFDLDNVSVLDVLGTGWGICTATGVPVAGCLAPTVTFPNGSTSNNLPEDYTIVNGYLDLNMNSTTAEGADSGFVGGYQVINGKIDLNGSGAIDAGDAGVFNNIPVIAGMFDVNRSGAIDAADDSSLVRLSWDESKWTGGQLNMAPNQELRIVYTIYTTAAHGIGAITTSPVTAYGSRTVGVPAIAQTFNASAQVANMYTNNAMTITKWSKTTGNCGTDGGTDATTLYPGDSFCYRVKVTNTGAGALSNVGLLDTLPTGVQAVAGSAQVTYPIASFRDYFPVSTTPYTNNNDNTPSTLAWAGNWGEAGDGGAYNGGNIQVLADGTLAVNGLRVGGNANVSQIAIYRQANLSGASAATLKLKYRRVALATNADWVMVQTCANFTAPNTCAAPGWTTIWQIGWNVGGFSAANDGAYTAISAAIPGAHLTNTFGLRFVESTNALMVATDYVWFDDIQIIKTFTTPATATTDDPANMGQGFELPVGGVLAFTFNATVNNPLATGTTEVTNTASTTSTEIPLPMTAFISNPVIIPSSMSGSIGDRVWTDTNGDGVLDVGESGIAGVTVTLKDLFGTPLLSTTTDGQGRYLFTGVSFGSGYYVEVTGGLPGGLTQTTDGRTDNRTNAFGLITAGDYRDNFAAATYANSDGSLDWTTAWIESDLTGGGATGGEIQITGGELRINGDTGGTNNYVRRSVNIPVGATDATLTFDYRTLTVEAGDSIVVEVATNGGNTFTTLATYTGAFALSSANIDLTPYLSLDTRIRFRVDAGYAEADDYFFVDNFRVEYSGFTDNMGADLGYAPAAGTAVIGDRVWSDADGDGVQDAGEPGLGGVEVRLYPDSTGDGIPDTATITVIDGALDLDGDGAITTADAGWAGDRRIVSGKVDINGNGVIESGTNDDGTITIGGTTYNVYDGGIDFDGSTTVTTADDGTTPAGSTYRTATTAADGSYLFSVIADGSLDYLASINASQSALSAYSLTTPASFVYVDLADGGIYLSADFGAMQQVAGTTYAIRDRVWLDSNANGVQDGVEAGIVGVTVALLDGGGAMIATATTDANGDFTFTGVPKDVRYRWVITDQNSVLTDYTPITAAALAGQFQMPDTLDEADDVADGTDDDVVEYSDPSNPAPYRPNFGYNPARSIGDTVFNDFDGDGSQDAGEPGLSGVVVKLYSDGNVLGVIDGTDAVLATKTSDANGTYLFSGLGNGTYIVSIESPPASYNYCTAAGVPVGSCTGSGQPVDSDVVKTGQQRAAGIVLGVSDLDNDFGYQAGSPRVVSGTIWSDADQFKDIDASEARLSGVTVALYKDTNGNGTIDAGEPLLGTATTNAAGVYAFSGVQGSGAATDDYIVSVTDVGGVLSGYATTYEGPNTDGSGDDGVYNGKQIISNLSGDVTRNFGYFKAVPTYAAIASFLAYVADGVVTVEWRTSLEVGTAGFHLLRRDPVTQQYEQLNDRLLPGLLVSPQGGTYRFRDDRAPLGGMLTYKVVEVEVRGDRREYGPYTVAPADKATLAVSTQLDQRATGGTFERLARGITVGQRSKGAAAADERRDASARQRKRTGTLLKITTRESGLHYVAAEDVAAPLGLTAAAAAKRIARRKVALTNQGRSIPYLPAAGGAGFSFVGESVESGYTDQNVYRLHLRQGAALRSRASAAAGTASGSFTQTLHREEDRYPLAAYFQDPEADFWGWDYLFAGDPELDAKSFTIDVPAVTAGTATLTVRLQGGSDTAAAVDHHVRVSWNGVEVAETFGDGVKPWEIVIPLNPEELLEGENTLGLEALLDPGVEYSIVYLDSFDLTYERRYEAVDDELKFTAPAGAVVAVTGFSTANLLLLDVTRPSAPVRVRKAGVIAAADGSYTVRFATKASLGDRSYLAVAHTSAKTPVDIVAAAGSTLRRRSNRADYVLIAPSTLVDAAGVLAAYRKGQGWVTRVVDLEDVYDQFNGGMASPLAIRKFLRYATTSWQQPPRYATLVGRGTYDYLDRLGIGDNLMPPLLAGTPYGLVVSDTRFADLLGDDGIPEIAVGRIPVQTAQELLDYLEKVRTHEGAAPGSWQRRVFMAADNPDAGGQFTVDSATVTALVPPGYRVDKADLAAMTAAAGRQAIIDAVNAGVSLFNYIGHGGLNRLADENLFTSADVASLSNSGRLPVFLAMTCSVGNFAIPGYPSLAETLLLRQHAGAYAVWAASGLSMNAAAVQLDQSFFRGYFNERESVLGEIILKALGAVDRTGSGIHERHLFNLLGEPVSRLP